MKDSKKREYLIRIIYNYLITNTALMEYYKAVAPDTKSKRVCTKCIKSTHKAIERLDTIKHIEILEYLYSTFIGNNVIAYSVSPKLVLSKKISEWDSDKHFQEFLDEMEEQRIYRERKEQERIESQKAMQRAKEMGKKVQMVYNKEKGIVEPMIVEDNDSVS